MRDYILTTPIGTVDKQEWVNGITDGGVDGVFGKPATFLMFTRFRVLQMSSSEMEIAFSSLTELLPSVVLVGGLVLVAREESAPTTAVDLPSKEFSVPDAYVRSHGAGNETPPAPCLKFSGLHCASESVAQCFVLNHIPRHEPRIVSGCVQIHHSSDSFIYPWFVV